MTVTIETFTAFDGASVGDLAGWHGLAFSQRLGQVGAAHVSMDLAESSSDLAKVETRNVAKIRVGGHTLWAGLVDSYDDDETGDVGVRRVRLASAEAALGSSDQGGAIVQPYQGLAGRQSDPRRFGPEALEFDASAWPEPTSGGPPSTEGWPDDRTEVFPFTRRALIRRRIPSGFEASTRGRMFLVATSNAAVRVYLDGDRVLSKSVGQRGVFTADIDYDGAGDRVVLIEAETYDGGPGRVGWCWGEVAQADERLTRMMFRTFTQAVFGGSGAGGTIWRILDDYAAYPGMSPGYIGQTLVAEANVRGEIPWVSVGFDADVDSYGDPWDLDMSVAWPVGTKLPHAFDGMAQYGLDWWLTTNFVVELAQVRGEDRSATVTLASAGRSRRKQAERATSLLWLAADSMDEVEVVAAAERIADAVTLGSFDSAEAARPAAERLLAVLAEPEVVWTIVLADGSPQPGDFDLGDVVGFDGGSVRVVGWTCVVDDADGLPTWTVEAVPEDGEFSRSRARRIRDQLRLAFDQTAGGRSLLSSPRPSGSGGSGQTGQTGQTVLSDGGVNVPQLVSLLADDVVVASGWHPVVWDGVQGAQAGYEVDGAEVTVTVAGVHILTPSLTWSVYTGGGSVRVKVNGEVVWGPDENPQWAD